jgi:hypothetical protein
VEAKRKSSERKGGGKLALALSAMIMLLPGICLAGSIFVRECLFAARTGSVETSAIGTMRAYCSAQSMYKRNDWDGDGKLEYAADYRLLHDQPDGEGNEIQLLHVSCARAHGYQGVPKNGYLFMEMRTIGGKPIDHEHDYALCAIPAEYGKTGWRTLIVATNGTVWGCDFGSACFVGDYPEDPSAEGWIIAE